jgi:hypothetical protein
MTTLLAEVLDAVDARFAADRPRAWADPRPDGKAPTNAEYSPAAKPDQVRHGPAAMSGLDHDSARHQLGDQPIHPPRTPALGRVETIELTPVAPDAATPFVHFTGDYLPGVVLALGDPMAIIATVPVCGCGDSDVGRALLLTEIDNVFTSVLLGVAVVEQTTRSRRVVLVGHGSSSTGDHDWAVGRWAGQAWLDR